ncbi:hypothetical protein AB0I28_20335 [Phytomonospora sp. NPDC050363]|uniref:hypothetical protein n=1 Tax=Phytomonospora sp. NPDC050363 TaxID=3155642 RepID=UPI0033E853E7
MPSSTDRTRKLPKPIYAAAGAGELAMEQLRKLPGQFSELRDRAKLNERLQGVREDLIEAGRKVREIDTDKLRESAIVTAAKAQERAKDTYAELVTRGERVAAGERSPIRVMATIARPDTAGAPGTPTVGTPGSMPQTAPEAAAPAAGPAAGPAAPKPTVKQPTARKTTPRAKKNDVPKA